MSDPSAPMTGEVGSITRWARYGLIGVAWLFALGVIVQIFLAGLALFESASYWADHVDYGHMLNVLAVLMPVLAIVGRTGMPRIGQAVVMLVLYIVQIVLPTLGEGFIAALHPLNAFLLLGGSVDLGRKARATLRR